MVFGLINAFTRGTPTTVESAETSLSAVTGTQLNPKGPGKARFTITDGDTIRLNDGTPVRLVGFNTPEKFEPRCSAEAALGNRASARLKELVAGARTTEVALVQCACKPGTEGTKKCNYGRSCGTLSVDGRDVGQTLIAEGLAVSFVCGATRCPPTPRPWCG
nr:thermonuclease family protein [Rhizobium leguminosarum]